MRRSFFPVLFDDEEFGVDFPFFNENFRGHSGLSIYEDEKNIYAEAALPGLDSSDIEISQDKNLLVIKGEKKEETEDKKIKYHKKSHQSYAYRFSIPGNIDESKEPEAKFDKGILKITFAKKEGKDTKKIKIK